MRIIFFWSTVQKFWIQHLSRKISEVNREVSTRFQHVSPKTVGSDSYLFPSRN